MKNLVMILLLAIAVVAQSPPPNQAQPIVATQSFTASGVGNTITTGPGITMHTLSWTATTNTAISNCFVQVDGSPDGVVWNSGVIIASTPCSAGFTPTTVTNSGVSANYVRIHVTNLSSGNVAFTYVGRVGGV